jgi:acetyltransferase-like isoleucine patch superfamily enzyme
MSRHNYTAVDLRGTEMGSFNSIAGGVRFHVNDNHPSTQHRDLVSNYPFKEKFGIESYPESETGRGVPKLGNDIWIGEDAHILSGITIGDGAIIGAGAVVTKDVPPYAVVVGNPGKVHHYRFDIKTVNKLLKIKWWEWEDDLIKERIEDLKDVNKLIEKYGQKRNR